MSKSRLNIELSKTILQQMGGNEFIMMTGSRYFYTPDGIIFKLVKNKSKANYLDIKYNRGMDCYEMYFNKVTKPTARNNYEYGDEELKRFEGVYFDMLQDIFEQETGLYTKLRPYSPVKTNFPFNY